MRKNNRYTPLYNERKNRFPSERRYSKNKAEEAVRQFREKNNSLVLPLLVRKESLKVARFFLSHAFRGTRRHFGIPRRIQRARLSGRRRFFTGDDVSRAIHATSHALKRRRNGDRRGE